MGGFCFHTNVNGMWLLKQCMEAWSASGRSWSVEELIHQAATYKTPAATINVDAESLLLAGDMPERINRELIRAGHLPIPDDAGGEPQFARVIFESLAARYATALSDLQQMLGRELTRIHIIGGASRNRLLADLTSQRTGLPVDCGHPESSTIGNFAVQLVAGKNERLQPQEVRDWASRLCSSARQSCSC
jgi:rhamnulokinase